MQLSVAFFYWVFGLWAGIFYIYRCAMNSKEVIKILKQNGFEQDRQKGSHKHFRHLDGRKVIVPDHGAKDLKIGTLQNIEKTSGIKMR